MHGERTLEEQTSGDVEKIPHSFKSCKGEFFAFGSYFTITIAPLWFTCYFVYHEHSFYEQKNMIFYYVRQ